MPSNSRNYSLVKSGASFAFIRDERAVPTPGPGQVLLRVGAASLNYRDLLVLQDTQNNREGLIPLSDCAGTVKNASIHGILVGSVEQFERLNRFLATHRIHPVIDRKFGFDEAPAAYQHLKAAGHFGKVVIDFL